MKTQLNILLGGLGLFALQGCKAPQAEQSVQPNVIYVFPDQYRNQAMEFWGQEGFREKVNFRNDPVHTPRLNDFARESVVLTSAMSNCPLSSPHRGSLLTGMYPNKSGIPLNCNSSRPISSLREDAVCVSDVFCNAGYDCAYFGKLHADFPTPNDPDSMWKTVYLHGMPIRRKNVVMGSITGILTVPLTNTRIRITGIRKAVATTRASGHRYTNRARWCLI